MLSRFSVQKPFVVVVGVIVALILGAVSLMNMKTDLLPEMDLPYIAVITTDTGASAERVESEVTEVLEGSLATVSGVANTTSRSADNYSIIFLEFEDGTDMDSAMVKVSSAVNEVASQLPDTAGSPNYLEIGTDMAATMYVAVSDDSKDIYELTSFVNDKVVPEFERIDGVADVSVTGGVEQSVEVRLSQEKVDALKERVGAKVDEGLADTLQSLSDAEAQLDASQAEIDSQRAQLDALGIPDELADQYAQLDAAQASVDEGRQQVADSRTQVEERRDATVDQAVDAIANKDTLASLITAQNFSMPAGYITSGDSDSQWLLRVGQNFSSTEELESLVLAQIDGVGDVTLGDVADVTLIDDSGSSYMRVNGEQGLLLAIYKGSTASTNEVSKACSERITELEGDYSSLNLYVMMDQGSYIDLFIESILNSLLVGALLAVVVLALFLRDWKPTVIVAFSIPFSVLFALILMYFTDLTLNVLTLGGIALAIGMLVDNSIIVLENIYRLRSRGIAPARASVQGAKQITGAVVASTLTTICVFLPAIFTTGLVSQLLVPFALTIAYVLTASLVVALTLVPSVSTYMFKRYKPRREGWFERMQEGYGRSLEFFLRHKALPLVVAVALLAVSIVGALNTGITLVPSMTSKTISANVTFPEGTDEDTAYEIADTLMETALDISGVDYVGAMDGSSTVSVVSSAAASATSASGVSTLTFYIQCDDSVTTEAQVNDIIDELTKKTRKLDCEIVTSASSSEEMTSLLGSGLTVTIKGPDKDVLAQISEDVMEIVAEVDGYTEIDNGTEDAADEIELVVDKDKLARDGLTSAQLYQAIAAALSTETSSATMRIDGEAIGVTVVDDRDTLTKEDLLDRELTVGGKTVKVGDYCEVEYGTSSTRIVRQNSERTVEVTAEVEDGENNALLSRELSEKLDDYDVPEGYTVELSGELDNVYQMLEQMGLMALLGLVLIYLVMVAQFQSLLSPFIVLFTVPLAFTGGFFGLWLIGEPISMLSLMGFLVLMGTIVNNGIVFVDYVNQLRRGGLSKRDALVASGCTRMRPILMTALTTILSMLPLVFTTAVGGTMERGMAVVVVGGMTYATFMTLYIVPIMYDLLYRRVPTVVDLGDENIDDDPGDAQAYLDSLAAKAARAEDASLGAAGEQSEQTEKRAQAEHMAPAAKRATMVVPEVEGTAPSVATSPAAQSATATSAASTTPAAAPRAERTSCWDLAEESEWLSAFAASASPSTAKGSGTTKPAGETGSAAKTEEGAPVSPTNAADQASRRADNEPPVRPAQR